MVSPSPGATVTFDLDGSWLDLVAPTGPHWGQLAITIDGTPYTANRLPIVNHAAVLSLTAAGEGPPARHSIADGLGPGTHHVVVSATQSSIGIAGIVADRESPRDILYWRVSGTVIGLGALVVAKRWGKSSIIGPEDVTPRQP